MAPHRLRRGALHLPARRSRQNATFIHYQALSRNWRISVNVQVLRFS
jgi:hypothetical protein